MYSTHLLMYSSTHVLYSSTHLITHLFMYYTHLLMYSTHPLTGRPDLVFSASIPDLVPARLQSFYLKRRSNVQHIMMPSSSSSLNISCTDQLEVRLQGLPLCRGEWFLDHCSLRLMMVCGLEALLLTSTIGSWSTLNVTLGLLIFWLTFRLMITTIRINLTPPFLSIWTLVILFIEWLR